MKYFQVMEEEFSLDNDMRVSVLARFPEVFTMEEQTMDEEKLWHFVPCKFSCLRILHYYRIRLEKRQGLLVRKGIMVYNEEIVKKWS